jgi:hypothetical protein
VFREEVALNSRSWLWKPRHYLVANLVRANSGVFGNGEYHRHEPLGEIGLVETKLRVDTYAKLLSCACRRIQAIPMHIRSCFAALILSLVASDACANVLISIDKNTQQMTVSVDGAPRYHFVVSTGRAGYGTPNGAYHPQRLERTWFSKEYYNSPMPHLSSSMAATRSMVATKSTGSGDQPRTVASGYIPRTPRLCSRR